MKSLLDTQDGDMIDIDFADLYGLCEDVSCPDETQDSGFDPSDPEFLGGCWSNSVIEDSLETIRTVLATANLPANNRDIIEKSLTTLKNAIDLPPPLPSESQAPSELNLGHDIVTPPQTEEAELLHLEDWAPEVDTRCYDGLGAEAAENEERVREALGLNRAEEAMEVRSERYVFSCDCSKIFRRMHLASSTTTVLILALPMVRTHQRLLHSSPCGWRTASMPRRPSHWTLRPST